MVSLKTWESPKQFPLSHNGRECTLATAALCRRAAVGCFNKFILHLIISCIMQKASGTQRRVESRMNPLWSRGPWVTQPGLQSTPLHADDSYRSWWTRAHIQHSATTLPRCNIALVGGGRWRAKKATRVGKSTRVWSHAVVDRIQKTARRQQLLAGRPARRRDNIRTASQ